MYYIVLLVVMGNPLNDPIQLGSIIDLPPNVGYGLTQTEYEYRVVWNHENHFNVIKQFHNDQLVGAFVLYSIIPLKTGQSIAHDGYYTFVKIGTATYYKRMLHILYPIHRSDKRTYELCEKYRDEIKRFYGGT